MRSWFTSKNRARRNEVWEAVRDAAGVRATSRYGSERPAPIASSCSSRTGVRLNVTRTRREGARHVAVILGRVETRPGQEVGAGLGVLIARLVEMPHQREQNRTRHETA